MATQTLTKPFTLEYVDTVGFVADQGGRGFHLPTDMAIRDDGRIFVASRSNTTALDIVGIQMVTAQHGFFGQLYGYGRGDGEMIWPSAVALDSDDYLYMADDFLQRVTVYDPNGNFVSKWGTVGHGKGEFDGPSGLIFDAADNLLLVDHRNHRVQKMTKDGEFISSFGSYGDGDGEFNLPWGIELDREGCIYIADWRNDRVQKFTPDGEFIASYGETGDGDGQFNRPSGLAVDSDGNMYVADWGNQRVQALRLRRQLHHIAARRGDARRVGCRIPERQRRRVGRPLPLRPRIPGGCGRRARNIRPHRVLLLGPGNRRAGRARARVCAGDLPASVPGVREGVGVLQCKHN